MFHQTNTLTTGVNEFTGGPGDDVFNAPLVEDNAGDLVNSLQSADVLDGGAGTDRLNATLDDTLVLLVDPAPTISSIEEIYIRSVDVVNPVGISFEFVTGAEQIWNDRSLGSLDIHDVQNAVTIGLSAVRAFTTYSVAYAADALDSDEHTQALVLNGAGTADDAVILELVAAGTDVITGLDITAAGVNNVEVEDGLGAALGGIETVAIAGSGDLTLDVDFTALTTLAAATFAGDLVLDLSVATLESVVTGAGDDVITVDGDLLLAAAELAINLGAGENTLGLTAIDDDVAIGTLVFTGDDLTIAGVSTLSLVDAITLAADATLDLDGIAPSALAFEGAIDGDTFTLSLDNTATTLAATFEAALGATTEAITVDFLTAEVLNINAEADVLGTTLVGNEVISLTVNATESGTAFGDAAVAGDEVTILGQGDADLDTLTSLTLTDASDDADVVFAVTLDGTTNLATINANVGHAAGDFDIDASDAAFDGAVTINVEFLVDADDATTGTFDYIAEDGTNAVRETFVFTGDNLGAVTITDFVIGIGANADRLDLSAFGITDVNDLVIVANGGDALITAANGEFDGSITLMGVADTDLSATNFLL